MAVELRSRIQAALHRCGDRAFAERARELLAALGYRSEKTFAIEPNTAEGFRELLAAAGRAEDFNPARALADQWRSVDLLFQLTAAELAIPSQMTLAFRETAGWQAGLYQSFLFLAIDLAGGRYTRTQLADITRAVNKPFNMPVPILFRHGDALTFAIILRRQNKTSAERDVLEKVTLIKDIALRETHAGQLRILEDLALENLRGQAAVGNFDELLAAWSKTLDVSELNKSFYRELANWYFWARQQVTFPPGAGVSPDERNAVSVIRLITRLIFVWFIKEKGLAPDALFDPRRLGETLIELAPDSSSFYKAILQNLFFATLNTEMQNPQASRRFRGKHEAGGRDAHRLIPSVYRYEAAFRDPAAALALFADIPFLNGGLFECLDRPLPDDELARAPRLRDLATREGNQWVLRVDGFSDRADNPLAVPNRLFFCDECEVDLNDVYGTHSKRYRVRGLVDLFNRYKFTVEENTPVEEEVALDPELLGKVFENLLAAFNPETGTTARKQTGSFYTPREIVNYMADEALIACLAAQLGGPDADDDATERLRHLFAYNTEPHRFTAAEVARLIAALDDLKILDPACGSGAFPMGILHKLVFILGRLDPDNDRWRARQRQRAIAETEDAYRIGDQEARRRRLLEIEEVFAQNASDYGRKLFLIENCIYGVDIQPIAVQIAKLRCFISLIVDQGMDDARPNRGVRPLPNLETKFVAANTLIGVARTGQMALTSDDVTSKEAELRSVRAKHLNARTPDTKEKYRQQDKALRVEIAALLEGVGLPHATAEQLATWDPYDQNASAPFFDPEWMFGLREGFGIVIGNPPYVRQEAIKELKPALQAQYGCYTGTADLYVYFYEAGYRLLRAGGVLSYISSNKYFRSGYGEKLRALLGTQATIHELIDFGDAPVFTAIAYPSIIIVRKAPPGDNQTRALTWGPGSSVEEFAAVFWTRSFFIAQKELVPDGWRLEMPSAMRLLERLKSSCRPLGEHIGGQFFSGIKTGLNEAFVIDQATRDRMITEHRSSNDIIKPFLRGRNIERWRVDFGGQYLIKIESSENKRHPWSGKSARDAEAVFAQSFPAVHAWFQQFRSALEQRDDQGKYFWESRSCVYWDVFEKHKIVYPDIYEHQSFAIDQKGFYCGNTCYFIPTGERWLCGLLNSQLVEWVYSHLSNKVRGGYMRAFTDYMKQIPIPPSQPAIQDRVGELVDRILASKDADPAADVSALEREIDQLVYRLYGLTAEEIRIVEGV